MSTPSEEGDEDRRKRARLSNEFNKLQPVEKLNDTAFLFSSGTAGGDGSGNTRPTEAVVQVEVQKPVLTLEAPEVLRSLLSRSLDEDTPGTWFSNDRYNKKTVQGACDAVVELIFPAEKKDILKRKAVELRRLLETPALYSAVTFPKLIQNAAAKDAWVANIIEGKKEQEHVIQELSCKDVIVVKDYKWQDMSNTDGLYYLAIFRDMTIRSLRDICGEKHLEVLRRVRDEVVPGLAKKFGLSPADLLAYVHYFPTFWYFHVHIVCVRHPMFGGDGSKNLLLTALDRFHKLDNLISFLSMKSDYYKSTPLAILVQPHQLAWYEAAATGGEK